MKQQSIDVATFTAGRSVFSTDLPWTNGAHVTSPAKLAGGNCWEIHFTPGSGSLARLVGAEDHFGTQLVGGPVQRKFILYRADTQEVIYSTPGQPLSTVQLRLAVNRAPEARRYEVAVQSGVPYVLAIVNNFDHESSAMFMDLFIA